MESREESIERDKILMSVKRTSLLMDPFFKIGAAGTVMMVVFLARMVKEHKLNKGEFKDFQEFLKATGGKYKLVNIPVDKKNGLAWLGQSDFSKELDKLRELGIRFTVMPDLMLMYGKEASNRKQEIDCQYHTIPNQRPKDKHYGNVHNRLFRHG